jgi:hypothetical protein
MTAQFIADVLLAAMTPLIALIAVCIAYQQHKINQSHLRHELYERRLRVYKAVQGFLSEILRDGNVPWHRTSQFYADASEAVFLFDSSIQKHIDLLYEKAIDLHTLHEKMYPSDGSHGLPVGEERSKAAQQKGELLKWLTHQLSETKQLFRKHMGIE